ncbi:hypothetical protein N5J23_15130 [Comamonas aquatica]|uniref:Uncharacterized protein n=1 Tax=Comamonas aquatica TaxID=225991 RepID=A0AA42W3X9_9BURK|nr:hypothetical protein [Comamonas aquatica]MDH1428174.1 hypothetical protein [Comamonas aquatica]MDH1607128.1 hypothetical protein [Comamonas aquatica]MDH1618846.1 hypothetical protein [Comamonas aquatica]MDH2006861.1 hypothetical protein [Comamonas aquatica]
MDSLISQPLICPFCHSAEFMIRAPAQKSYAVIGCVVGAAGGFNAAVKGLHVGRALAAHVGPISFAFTGIAGAVICALAGSAIGAELGAKAGSKIDQALMSRYRCSSCKQAF